MNHEDPEDPECKTERLSSLRSLRFSFQTDIGRAFLENLAKAPAQVEILAARHRILLNENDPAFAIVTSNQLVLEAIASDLIQRAMKNGTPIQNLNGGGHVAEQGSREVSI